MKKFTLFLAAALLSCVSFAATFEKVTAAPDDWSGEYILVYEVPATKGGAITTGYVWTGVEAAKCSSAQTIAANKISADGLVTITIAAMDGGYSVLVNGGTNKGKYAGVTSYSNGLEFSANAIKHRITIEQDGVKLSALVNTNQEMNMRFNKASNQLRFRYYKSGQQPVQLYKKSASLDQVASPTITADGTAIAADTYIGTQNISLACATEDAVISYSLDNGETWTPYAAPITINKTTTLKAKATKDGLTDSEVKTVTITILASIANTQETALTTAQAITLIDNTLAAQLAAEKVYVKGTISEIESYNKDYNSITYWLDNKTFEVYSGKGLDSTNFASIDDIAVGGEVIVYGNLKKHNNTYEFDYNSYLVSYTAPADPKSVATITLGEYQYTLAAGVDDEYSVTYNGDGKLSVTSSNKAVAEAVIVDGTVLVSAVAPGKTTITFSAPETDNYLAAEKTYTLTVTAAWAAAALPFEFNGKKAAMDTIVGIKGVGLGDDYKDAPHLRFDNTNDSLLIWYNDKANTLAYTIKGNGFSGGTFDVKESTDGVAFTTVVESITTIEGSATEKKNTLKEPSRFVLFTYKEKVSGNVALGGIIISYVSNPTAIESAVLETPALKTIENGQLVILRDGVKYNAMGVRLQ